MGGLLSLKTGTQLLIIINKRNVACLLSGSCEIVQSALDHNTHAAGREWKRQESLLPFLP